MPPVIVYVTVRLVEDTTPAAAVALSEYETAMPLCACFVMPVMTSTAVVLKVCEPALAPTEGALTFTDSARPLGMFEPMLAVIFAPVWLVVTAHVPAAVALEGSEPAVAVLITSDGLPEKAIWLIASTWKVTVCVAVWAAAWLAARATRPNVAKKRLTRMGVWSGGVFLLRE